jgi:aldose 1-epimerase
MGNPVATTARPTGNQWLIESDDHRAVVVEVGGGIRMYQYKEQDYLDGYADNEIESSRRGTG